VETLKKKSAVEQHRDILLATIDYLQERTPGRIKFDGLDPDELFYEHMRQDTDMYYKKGRTDGLKRRFRSLVEILRLTGDAHFGEYIKEKTGYGVDIFEDLHERTDKILSQKIIKTEDEYRDAIAMTNLYQQTTGEQKKIDRLNELCNKFIEKESKRKISGKNITEIVTNSLNLLTESWSPDNRYKITVAAGDDGTNNTTTKVFIHMGKAAGCVYAVSGNNADITIYWKGNNTVVIETKKEYPVITKHQQAQTFQDIVSIIYIES
jgi:hypothetical protein